MHRVFSYGDLYKHFGRSLHADKDLISSFAQFKILEMSLNLVSCQALIHQGVPSARTLII